MRVRRNKKTTHEAREKAEADKIMQRDIQQPMKTSQLWKEAEEESKSDSELGSPRTSELWRMAEKKVLQEMEESRSRTPDPKGTKPIPVLKRSVTPPVHAKYKVQVAGKRQYEETSPKKAKTMKEHDFN